MARVVLLAGLLVGTVAMPLCAAGLSARQTAERLNVLLGANQEGLAPSDAPKMTPATDEVFLRRATLDLVGRNPTPREIETFTADTTANKHATAVDRLLAAPEFGVNWGYYWRDAMLARRTEPRAEFIGPALASYFAERFNEDAGWNQVAKEMITAIGSVREHPEGAIILAQSGGAEEIAAEVSRLFLGVQIQCAQCHDHPTDRWKRQQFHELAAFFARVETKVVRQNAMPRFDFEIIGRNRGPVYVPATPNGKNRSLEHFMPDLNDPKAQGKLVQPVLFLTDQRLDTGKTDELRRDVLAAWMTDAKNPWFAKAFVNRVWTELVGWGFYEPIDDLGPDREAHAPKTLDFLAGQFIKHDYQVKWLFRTIMATDAYRRAPGSAQYVTMQPTRLRNDQLFDCLIGALGADDLFFDLTPRRGPLADLRGPRYLMAEEFGFDPSEPRSEQSGAIPQALLLMNAKAVQRSIDAENPRTMLGRLLEKNTKDEEAVTQLYLRALARLPTANELATSVRHIQSTKERAAAFEDLLWALLNSTEMLQRR